MSKKTIYDLSKELKISTATISKALNNVPGVNARTRQKIINYANETGYFANPTAVALKSKKNYTIGILYSEDAHVGLEHPFFSPVLQSAKEYLENNGFDLIFINSKSKDYRGYSEFCSLRKIAGVFVVSASSDDILLKELVKNDEFKVVATDYINDNVPTVVSDNKQGISDLIDYFVTKNIKKVGLISCRQEVQSLKERRVAFLRSCQKRNIEILPENIILVDDYSFETCHQQMGNYIQNKCALLPEAFFALSDVYAIATIKAFNEHGVFVPTQCSVVGFDDIELSRYFTPSVTTLRQNAKEIGKIAAKVLIDQLNGENVEKIYRVPVELVIRNSSK